MDYGAKAREWADKADKRLKAFSFFGGNKYEDAADMYEKAANQFKLAKQCTCWRRWRWWWRWCAATWAVRVPACSSQQQRRAWASRLLCKQAPTAARVRTARLPAGNDAGETFTKLADVHLKLESKHDAAGAWVEAAKAYLKSDQRRAWWWPAVVVASCFRPLSLHPAPLSRWRSSSAGRRQAACDMQRASCASASCHLLLATPAPCRSGGVLATGSGAVH